MYKIINKVKLNNTVTLMDIEAPAVAKKAEPGQFIILRTDAEGERIPLTVSDFDREKGTVRIIFQTVGATTLQLSLMNVGECLQDFAGPLGMPTKTDGLKKVLIVGGGVGCAIALPIAKKLKDLGAEITSVIGFRTRDLVILEDEFNSVSDKIFLMTDDGSYGNMGNVCAPINKMLSFGERFDEVIVVGPIVMMKFVVEAVKPYNIPCTVSMNPIMIDGTGMCGGCRLTLNQNGQKVIKFACVDGPDFNGYEVDFDEAIRRGAVYREFERHSYEKTCNLFKKEAE